LFVARSLVPAARRDELEGDLLELWTLRRQRGRRALLFWCWRDIVSVAWHARRGAPPTDLPSRSPLPRQPLRGITDMLQDLRYTLRLIRRQPTFAVLVIATLALGIGASTAIFTICDRVIFRALPYPRDQELVSLEKISFSFANQQMRVSRAVVELPVFSAVGMYASGGLNLGDESMPIRLRAAAANAGFFDALAVPALYGRTFSADEDIHVAKVAIVSFEAWRRVFRSGDLLGREIRLNSQPFTVIGVMPRGFAFPAETDVWILPASDRQMTGDAFAPKVLARTRPGVSLAQIADALARLDDARYASRPAARPDPAIVKPLRDELYGGVRPTAVFLAAGVGLLLTAMCANVGGLLLARLRIRERELVLRLAIGADRGRLVRQLVTECLTLSAIGMMAGTAVAAWSLDAFRAAAPAFVPNADLVSIDGRFVMVALVVSAASGLLFSIAPALAAGRTDLAWALRAGTTTPGRPGWLRHGLVVGQVAAALVLLTTASAALGVVARLMRVDIGLHGDRSIVFDLTLPTSRYRNADAIVDVIGRIDERLRQAPGVRRVGLTNVTPGSALIAIGIRLERAAAPDPPDQPGRYATLLTATPDYFETMGVRLIAGRPFAKADRASAPGVVILSESSARALWPDPQAAIGQRLRTKAGGAEAIEPEVVGIVADVRLRGVTTQPNLQAYLPIAQSPPFGGLGVVVEAAGDPAAIVPAVRAGLREVDSELPPYNVTLVRDLQSRYLANQRLTLALTSAFAAIALVLSAIGLYGVLTQLVAERSREIGIRMALGANRGSVRRAVVWTGLRVACFGVALGALASTAAVRLIARFVPALDPPSIAWIAANAFVLVAVAVLAAWIPARRASSVDPLVALKAM
jgi:predicted permease